jgi:hypothetical protein
VSTENPTPPKDSDDLLPAKIDQARLTELETIIERGKQSFIEVGQALEEVRDSKLYKEHYGTFEEYCELRWGFKKSRVYQMMEASQAALQLPEAERPKTERAMRKSLEINKTTSTMVDKATSEDKVSKR